MANYADEFGDWEDIEAWEELAARSIIRRFHHRQDPFQVYSEEEFKQQFRLSKECTQDLFRRIQHHFPKTTNERGLPVPPSLQLLVALSYMASGNFQLSIADKSNVSQASVSKYVKCVSTAIASLAPEVIKFPQPAEEGQVMEKFVSMGGMPDVIGCINGSYIPMVGVSGSNPELYRCEEGFFSINVMAVCDADLRFTSLITGWAGSVNNSRIFSSSNLHDLLESGVYKGYLLGDSGYACHPYLMTPCLNPATEKERRYNLAHAKTRNAIEKAFGIWKSRFAILKYKMRTNLRTSNNIIIACAVLHNMALESRLDLIQESENVLPDAVGLVPHALAEDGPGRTRRDAIIDTQF